jgi:hypothetical protein
MAGFLNSEGAWAENKKLVSVQEQRKMLKEEPMRRHCKVVSKWTAFYRRCLESAEAHHMDEAQAARRRTG